MADYSRAHAARQTRAHTSTPCDAARRTRAAHSYSIHRIVIAIPALLPSTLSLLLIITFAPPPPPLRRIMMPILTMTTSNRCNTFITRRHNTHKGKRSQRSRTTISMLTIEHTMYKHLIIFHLFMIMISQLIAIIGLTGRNGRHKKKRDNAGWERRKERRTHPQHTLYFSLIFVVVLFCAPSVPAVCFLSEPS